jgi:hypothetical protein
MGVIHHEGCNLDPDHSRSVSCVRRDVSGSRNVLGYPAEHSRGCMLGDHGLGVPCSEARYIEIPAGETPEQRAARHLLDKPLITAFDRIREEQDGVHRAKVRYGGLVVDVSAEDDGLFGRVLSAIGGAIAFGLGDDG